MQSHLNDLGLISNSIAVTRLRQYDGPLKNIMDTMIIDFLNTEKPSYINQEAGVAQALFNVAFHNEELFNNDYSLEKR